VDGQLAAFQDGDIGECAAHVNPYYFVDVSGVRRGIVGHSAVRLRREID
jgi:hypothetical protein